jgi:YD repeat-containing protein
MKLAALMVLLLVCDMWHRAAAQSLQRPASATQPTPSSPPRLAFTLPRPIQQADCDLYIKWLRLSEAQQAFLARAHGEYRKAIEEIDGARRSELIRLSIAGGAEFAMGYSPQAAALYEEFERAQSEVREHIVKAENRLFDDIESMLAEEQVIRFKHVRSMRARQRCFPLEVVFPSIRVDLAVSVYAVDPDDAALAALDEILSEYDDQVTPLVIQLAASVRSTIVERVKAVVRLKYDDHGQPIEERLPIAQQTRASVDDWIEPLLAERAGKVRKIHAANRQFMERLCAKLPADLADKLTDDVLAQMYPRIFPDLSDPKPVYELAQRLASLNSEERTWLGASWKEYRGRYDQLNQQMIDRFVQASEQTVRLERVDNPELYIQQMSRSKSARWDLNLAYIESVTAMLEPKFTPAIREAIGQCQRRVDQLRDLSEFHTIP